VSSGGSIPAEAGRNAVGTLASIFVGLKTVDLVLRRWEPLEAVAEFDVSPPVYPSDGCKAECREQERVSKCVATNIGIGTQPPTKFVCSRFYAAIY
jgi:hypothetical protein